MIKVVFIPGNGSSTTKDNWFPSVKADLEVHGLEVIASEFPDKELARQSYWLPYLSHELKADHNTILVGHSSGAVAAIRYAEQYQILGSVLVGTYYTDLGIERGRLSGYFKRPWNWEKIRNNQKFVTLFASQDDPWIPIEQLRFIHKSLNCEYHEYINQGHFGGDYFKAIFPEITLSILNNIQQYIIR
ncbi:MAG: alpha/beta hydrolase [Sphingobacteriia bacterium]|nr:alpha/beta hydrolase [Sphingobacteriia bacterium]